MAGDRDWVATHGFGISTAAFSQEAVGPGLVGWTEPVSISDPEDDPNFQYLHGLRQDEQEAYERILIGPDGCMEIAQAEFMASIRDESFLNEFGRDLDDIERRVDADERMLALEEEIADCMAGAGYRYETFDGLVDEFYLGSAELSLVVLNPDGPQDGTEADSSGEEEIDVTLTTVQRQELAELQDREVATALAAFDCSASQGRIWTLREKIRAEYEQQFVEGNQGRLDAFLAQRGAG